MLDWFIAKLFIAFIFSSQETKKKHRKHKTALCATLRANFILEVWGWTVGVTRVSSMVCLYK